MHQLNVSDGLEKPSHAAPRAPWGSLALMVSLAIMSMVDRLILALLVKPLRADLNLSDVELGLLFGTAFAVFYGIMGLPLARVADQYKRVRLVTIAVSLWSLCTILSGFASTFSELIILRAGLALGEAALFPAVHSLIHDMFEARQRPLAASIASAAPPFGGAVAFMAGGGLVTYLERWVEAGGGGGFRAWQLVFFSVGLFSLLLGLLFGAIVREPMRHDRLATGSLKKAFAQIRGRRLMFMFLLLAGGTCQIMPYAYQAWAPTLLTDKYGLAIGTAGLTIGLVWAFSSVLGALILPLIVIRQYDKGRLSALATIPLAAIFIGAVAYSVAPLQPAVPILFALVVVGTFASLGSNSVILVAMQRLAPDNMRATMVATTLLVSSALGLGAGPVAVAYLANQLSTPPSFDVAMCILAGAAGLASVILFLLARTKLVGLQDEKRPESA